MTDRHVRFGAVEPNVGPVQDREQFAGPQPGCRRDEHDGVPASPFDATSSTCTSATVSAFTSRALPRSRGASARRATLRPTKPRCSAAAQNFAEGGTRRIGDPVRVAVPREPCGHRFHVGGGERPRSSE